VIDTMMKKDNYYDLPFDFERSLVNLSAGIV
jgi:hypothetical protein